MEIGATIAAVVAATLALSGLSKLANGSAASRLVSTTLGVSGRVARRLTATVAAIECVAAFLITTGEVVSGLVAAIALAAVFTGFNLVPLGRTNSEPGGCGCFGATLEVSSRARMLAISLALVVAGAIALAIDGVSPGVGHAARPLAAASCLTSTGVSAWIGVYRRRIVDHSGRAIGPAMA